MKKKKALSKRQVKKSDAPGTLLAKIERLERKLDLLNTLSKTMPVIIISTGAILGSLIYLLSVATIPETSSQLPTTGEELTITNDFVILYPEYYSSISLPDEAIGLAINGFYADSTEVKFFAQKQGEDIIEIGKAQKGSDAGEYKATWESTDAGRYFLWAKISEEDGTEYKSTSIIVDIN